MLNLVIASGKGGTGKTTIALSLALIIEEMNMHVQLLDCDVEEPNIHLFLKPEITDKDSAGIPVPCIDLDKCSFCGRCSEICAFNALAVLKDHVMVLTELCHGCGSCAYFCPEKAITEKERPIGTVEMGMAGRISFSRGILNPGEAMSPPLINAVKKLIIADALTIIDAPPGTSCPVVAAVSNCDFCLLVTEPTPFGLNDLKLAYQMVTMLGIPAGVVINRSDIGDNEVEEYCLKSGLPILQKIPWNLEAARYYARGEPAVKYLPAWQALFKELAENVLRVWKGAAPG